MRFHSILFQNQEGCIIEMPDFFGDLNLDQIIDSITAGRQEYDLKPFFYTSLRDIDTIEYRHEIMKDLEDKILFEHIRSFADKMHVTRRYLALVERLYYHYHKEGWFLEAVDIYCEAVNSLVQDLTFGDVRSRGFLAFREYLSNYAQSGEFTSLLAETKKMKDGLSAVKYRLLIKDHTIKVHRYEFATDYSADVEETFAKFKQEAVQDYQVKLPFRAGMNHIEAQILDFVAKLYPDIFSNLNEFCEQNINFPNEVLVIFDREIQFYMAYLEHIAKFKQVGLKFCYPKVSDTCKAVYNYEGFDLALANKLLAENSPVICNDFHLGNSERIFAVSGPNQGGKTTFARTFGQLHYLACIGCPVPGSGAGLFLFDRLFTHFEKEEDINNLRGKLQDDLIRVHDILNQATANSIVIMNEIFTSTTLKDAVLLGKKIMQKIIELDLLCVCVTFIDELASLSEKTVSMLSTVVPENPAIRTYKIVRKPADGLAHAISIAEKYRLTYNSIKERIKS